VDEVRRIALDTLSITTSLNAARLARAEGAKPTAQRARVEFRRVYNVHQQHQLPGTLERQEGRPVTIEDTAANEVYTNLGVVSDYFWNVHHRNSLDNQGIVLNGFVHYAQKFDNAYWDGKQMIFGDGDGYYFKSFARPLDVVAHELTHGVTQYEANLIYWKQPGALNESISDVFASLVKQYAQNQTVHEANWLLGEELYPSWVKSGDPPTPAALRSLKNPGSAYNSPGYGKDPQPKHMRDYVRTAKDYGGVHYNSGIPNHAFYLTAMRLGGYAWEKAGHIWYRTLVSPNLSRNAQFRDFARRTIAIAGSLYGVHGQEATAVADAWNQVGVIGGSA
jgi:Zn-dependent metalloprotease